MGLTTTAIFVLVVYSIYTVKCQGQGQGQGQGQAEIDQAILRQKVEENLNRMVAFVIHPSARTSQEMIEYSVKLGGRPKTMLERIGYLHYIKKIARGIPEFMAQFITKVKNANGTATDKVDETRFDYIVTEKASEYSAMRRKEDAAAAASTTVASPAASGTGSGDVAGTSIGSDNANALSGKVSAGIQRNVAAKQNLNVAPDGTINLLDLFNAMNQAQNNGR